MSTDPETFNIVAGQHIDLVNRPVDAQTVYADSVSSLAVEGSVAKISFSEYMPALGGKNLEARIVLNLVFSRAGLRKMVNSITDSLDKADKADAQRSVGDLNNERF